MEYYDKETGTFNEERVAEISAMLRSNLDNYKNHPNPFKEKAKLLNGNKPKVGNEQAVIGWTDSKKNRHTIALKSGLTKKEKEALKADAWRAIEEIEGKNPHITKQQLVEELQVRNIKSKRQRRAALENPKRVSKYDIVLVHSLVYN